MAAPTVHVTIRRCDVPGRDILSAGHAPARTISRHVPQAGLVIQVPTPAGPRAWEVVSAEWDLGQLTINVQRSAAERARLGLV